MLFGAPETRYPINRINLKRSLATGTGTTCITTNTTCTVTVLDGERKKLKNGEHLQWVWRKWIGCLLEARKKACSGLLWSGVQPDERGNTRTPTLVCSCDDIGKRSGPHRRPLPRGYPLPAAIAFPAQAAAGNGRHSHQPRISFFSSEKGEDVKYYYCTMPFVVLLWWDFGLTLMGVGYSSFCIIESLANMTSWLDWGQRIWWATSLESPRAVAYVIFG